MLASIIADTSRIESKISELFEVLPKHVPDDFLSILPGLTDSIIFANSPFAVNANAPVDIVYALNFDLVAYCEVMSASRTFKPDVAHK